jgi:O-antigen/teichoic acid export membrane protein
MGVIIRQSIKGTIVNYIGIAIGIFTTFFVMTKYLTTEEVGFTRVLIDASTMFCGLAMLGTTSSSMRFYPYFKREDEEDDHGFFFWTLIIPFIGFLLYSIVFLLLKDSVTASFAEKSALFNNYYYFLFPMGFCFLYIRIFESNSNLLMRIAVPNFIREVLVRVLTLAVYLLYAFRVVSMDGFVILFCLVYVIATLVNLVYFFSLKKIQLKPDLKFISKALLKDYLLYTGFLLLAALSDYITPFVNTFFVSAKLGLAFTGIYTMAVNIVAMIEVPFRSLGSISTPVISRYMKEGNIPEVSALCKKVSLHQLLIGSFVFYLIWINLDYIYAVMPNGEAYSAAKYVVLILGASKLIYTTCSSGSSVISYSRYYYFSLFFAFFFTFLTIFLNNKLIPVYGINGAALATLLSFVLYLIPILSLVRFVIGVSTFSIDHLKVLFLMGALVLLYLVWSVFITPLFSGLDFPSLVAGLLECLAKTLVLGTLGVLAVYFWKISPDANSLIEKTVSIFIKKKDES